MRDPELLERTTELDSLDRCFQQACAGSGTAVMVYGAAGTGKTSLVKAFLASLDPEHTATVLWGGCDDLIAPRPFGPFLDMIHATGLLPDELAADPNREDLLVSLLGILNRPTRPAVLVVEDAHWADDASIDVMRYLARRLEALHAMLIVTSRDDEGNGGQTVRGLLTGSSSSAPIRMDLGPLSFESVRRLGRASSLEADYLHEVSGGNPLLVRQLLSADPNDATRLARETLMARAEGLSGNGRAVLQALAVLPEGADPALARTLFADRAAALHEAEGTGLLLSTSSHIRFRHELGRTAVIDAMSFGERMAATDRVLAALTETGEDPTVLVHIARAAGDGPRATAFALDGLDHGLAPSDHRGAWTMARIALECTAGLSTARVAELHSTAAGAGRAISCHRDALRHAERAVRLWIKAVEETNPGATSPTAATSGSTPVTGSGPGDDTGRPSGSNLAPGGGSVDQRAVAQAWLTLADLLGDGGEHLRARTALRNARELLEQDPTCREWVRCNTRLAAAAQLNAEPDRAVELATASVRRAEAEGWTTELVHALRVRGIAAGGPATADGAEDLDRARELGAVHGPPAVHMEVLLDLADGYRRDARTMEAEKLAGEVERSCLEHGLDRLRFKAGVLLAQIFINRGRTVEAERLASSLLTLDSDPGVIKAAAEATLARIMIRRADEQAGEVVDRTWNAAVKTGDIELLAFTGVSRLEHRWVQGDEEALRQFARFLAGLGERHRHHRLRAEALRVLFRLDGGDAAPEPFDGCPAPLAAALAGDHRAAADLWEAAGEPFSQAMELIDLPEAPAAFEGLRLLDRTGATRTADLARHRLRQSGLQGVPRGPRKSANGGVPVLTGRQIDVLRLIAKGHTNQGIADELYVARRTVDNHVSAILSRLGVDGRSQAVEQAVSQGLIEH